jgi:hypothetical protein
MKLEVLIAGIAGVFFVLVVFVGNELSHINAKLKDCLSVLRDIRANTETDENDGE